MNRKLLIWILGIIFSSIYVNGAYSDGLINTWLLTSDATDSVGVKDWTENLEGYSALGGEFIAGNSDNLNYNTEILYDEVGKTNDFTLCFEFETDLTGSSYIIWGENDGSNNGVVLRLRDEAGSQKLNWFPADVVTISSTTTIAVDTYYKTCARYTQGTGLKELFINGIKEDSGTDAISNPTLSASYIGRYGHDASAYFDGHIRNVCLWNRTLTTAEINSTYNSTGCTEAGPPASPSLTINTNLVNNTANYSNDVIQWSFNGTFTDNTIDLANCSLYIGETLKNTTEYNLSNNNAINWDVSNTDYKVNTSLSCTNFEVSSETGTYYYDVDNINPTISYSGVVDGSTYYKDNTLTLTSIFTDTNLYAYNITLKDVNGNVVQNVNVTGLSSSPITNVTSYNFANTGNYTWLLQVWDSHTALEIADYEILNTKTTLKFDDTTIYSLTAKTTSFTRLKDRYSFYIDTEDKIFVQCKDPEIIHNSRYKGHIVCFEEKKWIDFENEENEAVYLRKIDNNIIEVTTKGKTFNSIGSLNYAYETINFVIQSEDTFYLSQINDNIEDIEEGISMIWIILLYMGLTSLAFFLYMKRENLFGTLALITSLGFDWILTAKMYDFFLPDMLGTGFSASLISLGTLLVFMVWITTKLGMIIIFSFKSFARR